MSIFLRIFIIYLITMSANADVFTEGQISCLIEPSDEINLSSQVSGVVSKVHVERGDYVKRGKLMVSLESRLERVRRDLAIARDELSEKKLERNRELMSQSLLSGHETDELLTEKKIASLEVAHAKENLRQRSVYSPVNGLVTERHISVGEFVGDKPLMTIMVLDPLHAEVVMSAGHYGELKVGQDVRVLIDDMPEHKLTGKIAIVDKIIHAASGTFGVRVSIENKDQNLPSGLKCRILPAK